MLEQEERVQMNHFPLPVTCHFFGQTFTIEHYMLHLNA